MPATSSRSSPTTGKRECPDSMTTGRMLLRRVVALHDDHLRARHHDVAHLDLRDLQHALEHREHVGVDQAAVRGVREHVGELLEVARLAGERFDEASQPAARCAARVRSVDSFGAVRDQEVRIVIPETAAGFPPRGASIARRRARPLVVVTEQVQGAVHHHVRPVRRRASCPAPRPRAPRPARRSRGRRARRPASHSAARPETTARWSACPCRGTRG